MKVWLIWVQTNDGSTWLEGAWDDDSTAENDEGWREAVETARKVAEANRGEMRIQAVNVPRVAQLFEIPTVEAKPA